MQITVNNSVCAVSGFDEKARIVLENALRVTGGKPDFITGEPRVETYFAYALDGSFCFGTGLLYYVHEVCRQNGLELGYQDLRVPPRNLNQYPDARLQFTPHIDQFKIARKMKEMCRGVLNLATNFGKTFLILYAWWYLGRPTMLVTVPTQALLHQTAQDFADLLGLELDEIGQVGDAISRWRPITVAVANSAAAWAEENGSLPIEFDMLMVDEGHKGVAGMWQRLATSCDAFYRFWLSGTAYKKNDTFHEFVITALAGVEIAKVTNLDLVLKKRSSYPHIFWIKNKLDNTGAAHDEYHGQYKALKHDDDRNWLIGHLAKKTVEHGLTTIIFVEHVDHIFAIQEHLDIDHEVVRGSTSSKEQSRIKKGLKDGSIKCVIATSAWRQGVSIAGLDFLIQATGRKSEHERDQELGRVLRWSPRGCCGYADFTDNGLSMPMKHSKIRLRHMETHGFPVHRISVGEIDRIFEWFPTGVSELTIH